MQQKANIHNEKIASEIYEVAKKKVQSAIEGSGTDMKFSDLSNVINTAKQVALEEFDRSKLGDEDISKSFREKLTQNLENFHSGLSKTLDRFNERQNHYINSMQSSLDQVEYLRQDDFMKHHQRVKNEALSQVKLNEKLCVLLY